jgi:hypothetical protein
MEGSGHACLKALLDNVCSPSPDLKPGPLESCDSWFVAQLQKQEEKKEKTESVEMNRNVVRQE